MIQYFTRGRGAREDGTIKQGNPLTKPLRTFVTSAVRNSI